MALLLSGITLRDKIKEDLKEVVSSLNPEVVPQLAIIQVGADEASSVYIKGKIRFGKEIGVPVIFHHFEDTASEEQVIDLIVRLNADSRTEGILVQLPLPVQMRQDKIIETIDPEKDVDGLTSLNVKKLLVNDTSGIMPATTRGIISLLKANDISLAGKKVLVVGRSSLVGKPTALACLNEDATVTIAHHLSTDVPALCKDADVIISATGVPGLIGKKSVKKDQVIIDVGITRLEGKIVGDVAFGEVEGLVGAVSPVPGGVGPLTIASLFQNLLRKYTDSTIN
jgi:methylenetetrahydrofolate dehydrogenase (NADP+)/methenyltetrahydrofolate cyclohydrolase